MAFPDSSFAAFLSRYGRGGFDPWAAFAQPSPFTPQAPAGFQNLGSPELEEEMRRQAAPMPAQAFEGQAPTGMPYAQDGQKAHPNAGNDGVRMQDMARELAMQQDMGPVVGDTPPPPAHWLTIQNGRQPQQSYQYQNGQLVQPQAAAAPQAAPQAAPATGGMARPQPPAMPDYSPENLIRQANLMYGNWQQAPAVAGMYAMDPLAGARAGLGHQYQQDQQRYLAELGQWGDLEKARIVADAQVKSAEVAANQRSNPMARLEAAKSAVAQQLMGDPDFMALPPEQQQAVVERRAQILAGLAGGHGQAPAGPGAVGPQAAAPAAAGPDPTMMLGMLKESFGEKGGGVGGLTQRLLANPQMAGPEAMAQLAAIMRANPNFGGGEAELRKALLGELYGRLQAAGGPVNSVYQASRQGPLSSGLGRLGASLFSFPLMGQQIGTPTLTRRRLDGTTEEIPLDRPTFDAPYNAAARLDVLKRGSGPHLADTQRAVTLLEALLGQLGQ